MESRAAHDMATVATIAQISDLHIALNGASRRGSDRADALIRCIEKLNELRPDLIVATGDLTQGGAHEEYLRLRALLTELSAPILLLPGNHDDRSALRKAFPDHPYLFETSPHIAYSIDVGPMRIVALDSTEPGRTGGFVDPARLTWLQTRLAEAPEKPTLLAVHHPPFRAGVWPMDSFGFTNVDAFAEIVRKNPQVQRVISGHVHCARSAQWSGTLACSSPTPASQLLLRSTPLLPIAPAFERAGLLLHSCDGTDTITTQVIRLNGKIDRLPLLRGTKSLKS